MNDRGRQGRRRLPANLRIATAVNNRKTGIRPFSCRYRAIYRANVRPHVAAKDGSRAGVGTWWDIFAALVATFAKLQIFPRGKAQGHSAELAVFENTYSECPNSTCGPSCRSGSLSSGNCSPKPQTPCQAHVHRPTPANPFLLQSVSECCIPSEFPAFSSLPTTMWTTHHSPAVATLVAAKHVTGWHPRQMIIECGPETYHL